MEGLQGCQVQHVEEPEMHPHLGLVAEPVYPESSPPPILPQAGATQMKGLVPISLATRKG